MHVLLSKVQTTKYKLGIEFEDEDELYMFAAMLNNVRVSTAAKPFLNTEDILEEIFDIMDFNDGNYTKMQTSFGHKLDLL